MVCISQSDFATNNTGVTSGERKVPASPNIICSKEESVDTSYVTENEVWALCGVVRFSLTTVR